MKNLPPTLLAAEEAWTACAGFRTTRDRMKRFTYGRQWDDVTVTSGGQTMTEGNRLKAMEMSPLTNNLLRNLVKSVIGRFRSMLASGSRSALPDETVTRNNLNELDSRMLEEFLISGCAVQRVVAERRPDGDGVWIDNISPARIFYSSFTDPRATDLELIGVIHDYSFYEVKMRFGHGDPARNRIIDRAYSVDNPRAFRASPLSASEEFFTAPNPSRCRVIEVWSRDFFQMPDEPDRIDTRWTGRWYAPDGTLLDDTASPFRSGSHPFLLSLYPFTDGEIHPFIEDLVDNQFNINRTITILDKMLSASAKSLLLLPEDSFPEKFTMTDIINMWNVPGGVIPVSRDATRLPTQISSPAIAPGATELLGIQLSMFHRISGVAGILQGDDVAPSASESSVTAQVNNSVTALLDIFETFNAFRSRRDRLAASLLA